jgi:Carboxypeptidase regulatory-like domain
MKGLNDMNRVLKSGAFWSFVLTCSLFAALLLSSLGVQPARADNLYAKIQGTVTDPTGAVLSGAKLTATNVGTNLPYTAETSGDGNFVFLNLPIGTYRVTVTSPGFRTFTATGITLVLDQIYQLNVKMEIGQISEQVLVEAATVQVETTNTQLGTVINGDTIVDMPLNGRNWTQLQQFEPGVMSSSDRFGTYSTNGSQTQQNSFLINGQDSNDLPLNTPVIIPSPDAIAEFSMVTNTINPEYGRNSGAIMNAAIKSGTNSFHGSGFEFYRDTFLNDKDFFTDQPQIYHQNQFGGTVGGPIWKNHTFFFFSYQGTRFRQPQATSEQTVYTPAERTGDFSADGLAFTGSSPFPLFGDSASPCPVSGGVQCKTGTAYSSLFSTGVIPSQDLNPIATKLVSAYVPLPNAGTNGFNFSPIIAGTTDQYLWQVDHTFNSKDSLRTYGFLQTSPDTETLPFTGATLPGFAQIDERHYKQFTASWNHVFNSNLLNELRLGYTRFNYVAVEPQTPVLPSSLGFDINPQNPAGAGVPLVGITGFFTLGFSTNGPQPRIDQTYQLDDNISWVVGRHTFKFGFDGRRFAVKNPFSAVNSGSFSFGGSGLYSTGNPQVDFLLGIPDSYSQSSGGFIEAGAQEFYQYVQDSWKVSSNFTFNYGLAWQINTPTTDHFNDGRAINCFRAGQQSLIYPTAPAGLVFPGDNGCTSSGYQTGFKHFGPCLGLAWAPHASGMLSHLTGNPGQFSVRAGVGVYYNQSEEELTLQNLTAPPFQISDAGIGDVGGHPSFAAPFTDISTGASIPNKYPFSPPAAGSAVDFSFFEPMSLNLLDPRFTVPYSINDNVTIQREIPGQMILSVGYVGSFGRHEERAFELNPGINPAACAASTTCINNRVIQGFVQPANFKYDPTVFGSLGQQATDGNSRYNSLQASLNKRVSHGLTFLLSYTYAHSQDNGSSLENSSFGTRGTNPLVPGLNWGDSAFDARQRFVASYSYTIPVPHVLTSNGALSRVFQGWRVAGDTTFQTGFPINIADSNFTSLTCWAFTFYGCPDNPYQVAAVSKVNIRTFQTMTNFAGQSRAGNYYFAPASFCQPTNVNPALNTCPMFYGQFGNVGRDSFHGPGQNVTNLALMKDIQLKEQMRIELRLESYNTFNHVNFNAPTADVNSRNFGRITGDTLGPRVVQLAGKFYF